MCVTASSGLIWHELIDGLAKYRLKSHNKCYLNNKNNDAQCLLWRR